MRNRDQKKRFFWALWVPGLFGVLSLLTIDINAVISIFPEADPELPHWLVLKVASVLQPAVLMTVAVLVGVWLAPKVELHAPAAEAFAVRGSVTSVLLKQLLPGFVGGGSSGLILIASWVLMRPRLSDQFAARAEEFNKVIPAAIRFLYGGLTEEILLRWGMMTFLVWLLWRLSGGSTGRPAAWIYITGITVSALLFGLGHLPVALMLAGGLTVPLASYVVGANSLFGVVAGILYWKRGIEAAMIAHIFAHVVLLAAVRLAL